MVPGRSANDDGEARWLEGSTWLAQARRLGPLRYSDLGRRAVGPAEPGSVAGLGTWLADRLDRWWGEAGRPDPFTAVIVSGDDGALAAAVREAAPACLPALRYVLVDPDAAEAAEPPPSLSEAVPLENPAFLYPTAPSGGADDGDADPDDERPPAQGIGPLFTLLRDVPKLGDGAGTVIAVEVLGRLPYDLYTLRPDGAWAEVRVAADGERLTEITVPVDPVQLDGGVSGERASWGLLSGGGESEGQALGGGGSGSGVSGRRYRRLTGAADWLRRQLPAASAGTLTVVDRWAPGAGGDYLDVDQLAQVRVPVDSRPEPIEGTHLAYVSWHLG